MNIKKAALEKEISESLAALKANPGLLSEDRFAILCRAGYEVQVLITADKDDFLGEVYSGYEKAIGGIGDTVAPLTRAGQIKVGDILIIDDGEEVKSYTAKIVINAGTEKEEIVLRKKRNVYFITSMYLSGQSWVKDACIVRQAK